MTDTQTPELRYATSVGKAQPRKGNAASSDVYQMIMQEANRRGMTWFKSHQAMGMIGSFVQETGNFRKDVIEFDVRGDGGSAHGLMQWRGPRFNNLVSFAQKNGLKASDIRTQVMFAFEEGSSGSPYADTGSVRAFREMSQSRNIEEATVAFIHAERPAGYTSNNPAGAHDAQKRISHANKAAGVASSEGFQTANGEFGFSDGNSYDAITGSYGSSTGEDTNATPIAKRMGLLTDGFGSDTSYDIADPISKMLGTSRSFADDVTKGRGNPFDYKSNFGVP